jgi:hypothetical protein
LSPVAGGRDPLITFDAPAFQATVAERSRVPTERKHNGNPPICQQAVFVAPTLVGSILIGRAARKYARPNPA